MAGFLDDLDDAPAVAAEVVSGSSPLSVYEAPNNVRKGRELDRLTDEIFNESLEIIEGAMKFTHLDPTQDEDGNVKFRAPEEWAEMFGPEKAKRIERAAGYALMNKKEAPVGLEIARSMALGIIKAKSNEKGAARSLNVALVQLNVGSIPEYKVKDEGDIE